MDVLGIHDVRIYKFYRWHSGFQYFIGKKNIKKIFIKVCRGKYNTVCAEAKIGEFEPLFFAPRVEGSSVGRYNFVATEYLEIYELKESLNYVNACSIVRQACEILDELWKNGIVHRDIRPENVCINQNGQMILIDYGWAVYEDYHYRKTDYILIEEMINQEYRNYDGRFDDAFSMYMTLSKVLNISEEMLRPIRERIGRLVI